MLPTLNIGPLVLPTAGLTYILGAWLALAVVEKAAARLRLHVPATYSAAVTALVTSFVAARLAFVAIHWSAYRQNLLGIVWPLTSGYVPWIGILAGLAAAFFYGRAKRLPPGATADALAPGLLVAVMVVSVADFLAGPGYGVAADLPWSISLFGIRRHPVQIYELAAGFLALAAWGYGLRRRDFPGQLFLVSAAVYGAGRLFVDAYRANAWLTAGGYHLLQLLSLAIVLASLALLAARSRPEAAAGDDAPQQTSQVSS